MLVSGLITLVRAVLNQDGANNDQIDDTTQVLPFVQLEVEALRSQIADIAPHLFESTTSPFAAPPAAFNKPADFKRAIRLERQSTTATVFYPVAASDEHAPDLDWLNWRETGTTVTIAPADLAPGTYRLVYEPTVAALNTGSTVPLPPGGFEGIVVQRVAALLCPRIKRDPMPHLQLALDLWQRLKGGLKRRGGEHPVPGLKRERWRRGL